MRKVFFKGPASEQRREASKSISCAETQRLAEFQAGRGDRVGPGNSRKACVARSDETLEERLQEKSKSAWAELTCTGPLEHGRDLGVI